MYKNNPGPEYDWCLATIIDCGLDDDLDVALLECQFPEGINYYCYLESDNPKREFKWESEGFARAGQQDDIRPPVPLGGETYSAADGADWLVLTERGKASEKELWCGVSGSPAFIKGTNTIIGVILEIPPNYEAGRLHATPIWKLLQCEGFRREIGYDIRNNYKKRILKKIENILAKSQKASGALAEELSAMSEAVKLAIELINLPVFKLLKVCDSAITELLECDEWEAARVLQQIVYLLTPIVCDQSMINLVLSKAQYGVCSVPVATTTVAEIIMAGRDGRAVDFNLENDSSRDLVGTNDLHQHINCGIDGGVLTVDAVTTHLKEKFAGMSQLTNAQNIDSEDLIKAANIQLKQISEHYSRTLYYVYVLPNDENDRIRCQKVVADLKERFNAVIFMEISQQGKGRNDERETYFLLRKIHTTKIEG